MQGEQVVSAVEAERGGGAGLGPRRLLLQNVVVGAHGGDALLVAGVGGIGFGKRAVPDRAIHEAEVVLADTAAVTGPGQHVGGVAVGLQFLLAGALEAGQLLQPLGQPPQRLALIGRLLEDVMAPEMGDLMGHRAAEVADVGAIGAEGGPGNHHRAAGG